MNLARTVTPICEIFYSTIIVLQIYSIANVHGTTIHIQPPNARQTIIVGTEPIHLEAFNAALNTANECRISITRYCYRMTAKID